MNICCLSFISYIKPQLVTVVLIKSISCLSFISYIKPQLTLLKIQGAKVVYLLYPTSNHNCWTTRTARSMVVYLLYPTSNHNIFCKKPCVQRLFIFYILHQTTTCGIPPRARHCCLSFISYIKPQLLSAVHGIGHSCLSFISYIKPQLTFFDGVLRHVVYLLYPTSNHNL